MTVHGRPRWDRKVATRLQTEQVFCEQYFHPQGYHAPFHAHHGTEVLYSEGGYGTMSINGKEYPLCPGSVLIFPGYLMHRASVTSDYRRWNLCAFPSYFDEPTFNDIVIYEELTPTAQRNIGRIFENLLYETTARESHMDEYVQMLLKQLRIWIERGRTRRRENIVRIEAIESQTLMPKITHFIEQNLHEDLTVETLAEAFNYSRSQLWRLISSATGQSPSEYIAHLRVQRARALLLQGEHSIAVIANLVGFKSPAYFSRIFKAHTGVAPSEYRDQVVSEKP